MENTKSNYQLLDKILEYLILQNSYSSDVIELINTIYSMELKPKEKETYDSIEDFFNSVDFSNIENNKKLKVRFALLFLFSEKLITFNNSIVTITYLGIIQHSKGFLNEYQTQLSDKSRLLAVETFQNKISNRMLMANIVIALGTFVAMVYYILQIFSSCK